MREVTPLFYVRNRVANAYGQVAAAEMAYEAHDAQLPREPAAWPAWHKERERLYAEIREARAAAQAALGAYREQAAKDWRQTA